MAAPTAWRRLSLKDKAGNYRYPGLNGAQLEQLRQAKTIESVVGEDGWNLTTTDGDLPEDVVACYISPNAPNHWGMPALMGRWLIPSDAPTGQEPERVVVLGYRFWQRYYNGDPAIVGRTIQLVRKTYRIVGVMPPRFRWREADIYLPLKFTLDPNIYLRRDPEDPPRHQRLAQANAELQPPLRTVREGRHRPGIPTLSAWNCAASPICTPGRWGRRSTCCSARSRRCC